MRENPDTSLKILRLLADEEDYPSRLRGEEIASQLRISEEETILHVQCCVDNGLMDADILDAGTFGDITARVIGRIWGLTAAGQEFVRQGDADSGKFWKKAREHLAKVGVEATTSTLRQAMQQLVRMAIESGG